MTAPTPPVAQLLATAVEHHRAGRFQQAEQLYRQVLSLAPDNARALNNLGTLAVRFGKFDIAQQLFGQALKYRPDFLEALRNLGDALCATRQYAPGIECYEKALEIAGNDPGLLHALQAARRELRTATDPDYAPQADSPWGDRDCLWEDCSNNAELFVIFSGLGVGNAPPTFIFRRFLRNYATVDKLYLRDLSRSWYLRGIPGHSHDVQSTARLLAEKCAGYQRTVFLGCSAGALGAILFGELVRADKVLAFAPQTVLSEKKERELGDLRWQQYLADLRPRVPEPRYLDLAGMNPFTADIDVHYAAGQPADEAHARQIAGPGVRLTAHDSDSHVIALELRDRGDLAKIIEAEIPTAVGSQDRNRG